jgi:hypothetical protein
MNPFLFPWVTGWCFAMSLMLPAAPTRPQAEIVDLAEWRRLKRRA